MQLLFILAVLTSISSIKCQENNVYGNSAASEPRNDLRSTLDQTYDQGTQDNVYVEPRLKPADPYQLDGEFYQNNGQDPLDDPAFGQRITYSDSNSVDKISNIKHGAYGHGSGVEESRHGYDSSRAFAPHDETADGTRYDETKAKEQERVYGDGRTVEVQAFSDAFKTKYGSEEPKFKIHGASYNPYFPVKEADEANAFDEPDKTYEKRGNAVNDLGSSGRVKYRDTNRLKFGIEYDDQKETYEDIEQRRNVLRDSEDQGETNKGYHKSESVGSSDEIYTNPPYSESNTVYNNDNQKAFDGTSLDHQNYEDGSQEYIENTEDSKKSKRSFAVPYAMQNRHNDEEEETDGASYRNKDGFRVSKKYPDLNVPFVVHEQLMKREGNIKPEEFQQGYGQPNLQESAQIDLSSADDRGYENQPYHNERLSYNPDELQKSNKDRITAEDYEQSSISDAETQKSPQKDSNAYSSRVYELKGPKSPSIPTIEPKVNNQYHQRTDEGNSGNYLQDDVNLPDKVYDKRSYSSDEVRYHERSISEEAIDHSSFRSGSGNQDEIGNHLRGQNIADRPGIDSGKANDYARKSHYDEESTDQSSFRDDGDNQYNQKSSQDNYMDHQQGQTIGNPSSFLHMRKTDDYNGGEESQSSVDSNSNLRHYNEKSMDQKKASRNKDLLANEQNQMSTIDSYSSLTENRRSGEYGSYLPVKSYDQKSGASVGKNDNGRHYGKESASRSNVGSQSLEKSNRRSSGYHQQRQAIEGNSDLPDDVFDTPSKSSNDQNPHHYGQKSVDQKPTSRNHVDSQYDQKSSQRDFGNRRQYGQKSVDQKPVSRSNVDNEYPQKPNSGSRDHYGQKSVDQKETFRSNVENKYHQKPIQRIQDNRHHYGQKSIGQKAASRHNDENQYRHGQKSVDQKQASRSNVDNEYPQKPNPSGRGHYGQKSVDQKPASRSNVDNEYPQKSNAGSRGHYGQKSVDHKPASRSNVENVYPQKPNVGSQGYYGQKSVDQKPASRSNVNNEYPQKPNGGSRSHYGQKSVDQKTTSRSNVENEYPQKPNAGSRGRYGQKSVDQKPASRSNVDNEYPQKPNAGSRGHYGQKSIDQKVDSSSNDGNQYRHGQKSVNQKPASRRNVGNEYHQKPNLDSRDHYGQKSVDQKATSRSNVGNKYPQKPIQRILGNRHTYGQKSIDQKAASGSNDGNQYGQGQKSVDQKQASRSNVGNEYNQKPNTGSRDHYGQKSIDQKVAFRSNDGNQYRHGQKSVDQKPASRSNLNYEYPQKPIQRNLGNRHHYGQKSIDQKTTSRSNDENQYGYGQKSVDKKSTPRSNADNKYRQKPNQKILDNRYHHGQKSVGQKSTSRSNVGNQKSNQRHLGSRYHSGQKSIGQKPTARINVGNQESNQRIYGKYPQFQTIGSEKIDPLVDVLGKKSQPSNNHMVNRNNYGQKSFNHNSASRSNVEHEYQQMPKYPPKRYKKPEMLSIGHQATNQFNHRRHYSSSDQNQDMFVNHQQDQTIGGQYRFTTNRKSDDNSRPGNGHQGLPNLSQFSNDQTSSRRHYGTKSIDRRPTSGSQYSSIPTQIPGRSKQNQHGANSVHKTQRTEQTTHSDSAYRFGYVINNVDKKSSAKTTHYRDNNISKSELHQTHPDGGSSSVFVHLESRD